jgi:UDP-GlcNAc:undecaprenyl-phosphate GlcNAc-1-phosphate transferase
MVFYGGVRIASIAHWSLPLPLSFVVTVFWLLVTTNALNLIDGLDGLCAGMGLFATATLLAASIHDGNDGLTYATLPMVGALLGFLCYNLNPATVFLGDSGALLIGFLLGCYGILWTQKTSTLVSVLVPLLALSIPLLDVLLSVVRRILSNMPIFSADRGHIHHKLLDRGLSARQAMWVLYLFATVAAGSAILATFLPAGRLQWLAAGVFLVGAVLGVRQLRYAEFSAVSRMMIGGKVYGALVFRWRLARVEKTMYAAKDELMWWTALVNGARQLGLVSVEGPCDEPWGRVVLHTNTGARKPYEVALGPGESIHLAGPSDEAPSDFDLAAFGAAIQRTFAFQRSETRRRANGTTAVVSQ